MTQTKQLIAIPAPEKISEVRRKNLAVNLSASLAEKTQAAYKTQWRQLARWTGLVGLSPYPVASMKYDSDASEAYAVCASVMARPDGLELIDRYLKSTQVVSPCRRKPAAKSTVIVAVSAIKTIASVLYADAPRNPYDSDYMRASVKAVCRSIDTAIAHGEAAPGGKTREAPKPKQALRMDDVRKIVRGITTQRVMDLRDRAIILVGYASACRRSEIARLRVSDITWDAAGPGTCSLLIRRSKTDQAGVGQHKALVATSDPDMCPIRAIKALIAAAGLKDDDYLFCASDKAGAYNRGPAMLTPGALSQVLKRRAKAVGMDATNIAGHSLRRGFVSTAYDAGADVISIMTQTGHRSVQTVKRYIEAKSVFEHNAVNLIFKEV